MRNLFALTLVLCLCGVQVWCPASRPDSRAADVLPVPEVLKSRLELARQIYADQLTQIKGGEGLIDEQICRWSERILDGQIAISKTEEGTRNACKEHLARLNELERMGKALVLAGQGRQSDLQIVQYYLIECQIRQSEVQHD